MIIIQLLGLDKQYQDKNDNKYKKIYKIQISKKP